MMLKTYKPVVFLLVLIGSGLACFAQDTTAVQPHIRIKSADLGITASIRSLVNNVVSKVNDIGPRVVAQVSDYVNNMDISVDDTKGLQMNGVTLMPNIDLNICSTGTQGDNRDYNYGSQKYKSYSKTYPIDGNDRIKLSNQYGKITVNTWDRAEVKVDVQVKAIANDDNTAQKLLDGVQIRDSKNGDVVSFRTSVDININNNSSWKIWQWGDKKNHKVEIDYTVYMPAKTDLDVEDNYGSIVLPDLTGRIKISSSYGSVSAQNLPNAANNVEGSYGSINIARLGGGHLDYSYGNVSIGECGSVKGDLSYGDFKLGKLKGNADLDLSYVTNFKIAEMSGDFHRLNLNSSYSGVTLSTPGSSNFNFDITTTYGGFNYNDDKVMVTSKTPPDNSKHIGSTRNYKGHFGRENAEAQVNIHSSYGSVSFD